MPHSDAVDACTGEALPKAPGRRKRVLVLDDARQTRGVIAHVLRSMDLQVDEASDLADAVRAIQESGPPDLVCAELCEGIADALASCLELRGLRVLVLAASAEPRSVERVLQAGAVGVLSKAHFSVRDFRALVSRLLLE